MDQASGFCPLCGEQVPADAGELGDGTSRHTDCPACRWSAPRSTRRRLRVDALEMKRPVLTLACAMLAVSAGACAEDISPDVSPSEPQAANLTVRFTHPREPVAR